MKIKDILNEEKNNQKLQNFGSYIGYTVDYESRKQLTHFCEDFNLKPVEKDEMHIPLCISEYDIFGAQYQSNIVWQPTTLKNFQVQMSKNMNNQDIVYLSFESEELHELRKEIINGYDIEDAQKENWEPYLIISNEINDSKEIDVERMSVILYSYIEQIKTEELFKEPVDKEWVKQFQKGQKNQKNKKKNETK